MKQMKVSPELQVIVGQSSISRPEMMKQLWVYIKHHKLQDEKNKRNINADANLKKVFDGKATVNMFEMTKLVSKHLS